jgi:hypothetical protein
MRGFALEETRLRHHIPSARLSLSVFEDLVVGHLAEHGLAEIVRDMKGTEQAAWMAANETNRRAELEARWRASSGERIRQLHAQGLSTTQAARAVLSS